MSNTQFKDGFLLPPALWAGGKFPSHENYMTLLRRGRLFYSLDINDPTPAGPAVVERPCNVLYHTATIDHHVRPPGGGWKGFARNERLVAGVPREREYSAAMHATGIPLIVYQNDNNFDSSQFTPVEIAAMSAELEPFVWAFSKPDRQFACTNKPAWRKLLLERLMIRVGEYGADGVFWDNCTPFIHCRCERCRAGYREASGRDLLDDMGTPATIVADMRVFDYVGHSQVPKDLVPVEDPIAMRYLLWRVDRAIDFYRAMRTNLEAALGRRIIYTSNGHIGIAEQSAIAMSGVFDMVFTEDGYTAPPVSNAFNLRLGSAFRKGEGCPFVITRVSESAPTASMVKVLSAEGRALGGQADFWDFNYRDDPHLAAAALEIRSFHRRHAGDLYAIEKDANDTAIIYSWRSDLWTSAADSPAKMASALLEDLNRCFDIVLADWPPSADLSRYQLLILPHVEVLSDEWFSAIGKFLEGGGRVVSTGNTAQLDQDFHRRKKLWAHRGWQHLQERAEKLYARSRRGLGVHHGFQRLTGAWAEAIERALPDPSVRLESAEPVLTINHTRLPDGEAVHLVNRHCNAFPQIALVPREGLVARIRPNAAARRVTWLSPETGEVALHHEMVGGELRLELPILFVVGVLRIYASVAK